MGCGKTTVGRVLAHAWDVPFVDLDERIERVYGATVPELLAARGEPGFRDAEARALASLLAEPHVKLMTSHQPSAVSYQQAVLMLIADG